MISMGSRFTHIRHDQSSRSKHSRWVPRMLGSKAPKPANSPKLFT